MHWKCDAIHFGTRTNGRIHQCKMLDIARKLSFQCNCLSTKNSNLEGKKGVKRSPHTCCWATDNCQVEGRCLVERVSIATGRQCCEFT